MPNEEQDVIDIETVTTDMPPALQGPEERWADFINGRVGNFQVGGDILRSGTAKTQKELGFASERGNERVYVGSKTDPLVLLGQLKDVTGVDEYGFYSKSGAVYIAGYRLFEAVVDPGGILGDYTTIQAALDSGAKSIFLRDGIHILTANLTITGDNVTITGESIYKTIIQSGASEGADSWNIQITGDNVTLRNFTKTGIDSASTFLIDTEGESTTIDRLYIKNLTSGYRGINADTGSDLKVTNCLISTSLWPVYTSQDQSIITDNIISIVNGNNEGVLIDGDNCTFSRNKLIRAGTGAYGIEVGGDGCIVSENYLYSSTTTTITGVHILGDNNKVSKNVIEGWNDGIDDEGNFGSTIQDNTLVDIGDNGIIISSLSSTAGRGYHLCTGNIIHGAGGNGIAVSGGRKCTVSNNHVYDATADGFYAVQTSNFTECIFSNNQSYYCGGNGFIGIAGISPVTTHGYTVWQGNIAGSNTGRNFVINQDFCNITGNISKDNGTSDSVVSTGGNIANNLFL